MFGRQREKHAERTADQRSGRAAHESEGAADPRFCCGAARRHRLVSASGRGSAMASNRRPAQLNRQTARPRDRALPAPHAPGPIFLRTRGVKALAAAIELAQPSRVKRPALTPARCATPIADSSETVGAFDRHADHVGFELHQLVVAGRAAVDQQPVDLRAAGAHRVEHVGDLMGDRIERRAGERRARHAEGEAGDGRRRPTRPTTARPARRTPARCDAARIGTRRGEIARAPASSRRAARPPRSGSSRRCGCCPRRRASARRSARRASGRRPARRRRRRATAPRSTRPITDDPVPCVALTGPGREGAVGEEGGMRVRHHRADRNAVGKRRQAARRRERPDGGDDARHGGGRHVENRQQLFVPARRRRRRKAGCARRCRPRSPLRRRSATGGRSRSCRCRSPPPRRAACRAGRRSSSHRALAAENIGSSGRPLLRRMTAPCPAARTAAQTLSVRWSCHDRTGVSASPVRRSQMTQDSRWMLRPTETTRLAVAASSASATARRTLAQISSASCSHPARLRRRQRHRRLAAPDDLAALVDQQALGRARALIDGEDQRRPPSVTAPSVRARRRRCRRGSGRNGRTGTRRSRSARSR